ncbi:MAG: NAD(+) synthase [Gemmatimonadetes bacterium]|nr:MAG: NAD(+) synthase [Gemmatimonadota bacterium]PYO84156.1 MAG: NAD(+) synthase [Gemmatimonadota bacterium]PYP65108.1 MAG: NAD(+) synthase [Gemmatimonadota bacterium]
MSLASGLQLNPAEATERITATLRQQVGETLRRRGLVVAMSGGIDSSVCAALAARAVGPGHVFGLMLPERESDGQSLGLATGWAQALGIAYAVEDITPMLDAFGCYRRRNAAIRRAMPEFQDDWRCKVVLSGGRLDSERLNVSYLAVEVPGGEVRRVRLPAAEYREIVAATNFKQRARKMLEYFHADRLHFAVVGTPNRLEYDQGFFVKGGDGLADVKPIAHLYKSQVYALAEFLGVPAAIRSRPPTTDTYSLPQTQEEFFFALPAAMLDLVLFAHNLGCDPAAVAAELGRTPEEAARALKDVDQKRATTRYLHLPPLLIEPVPELTDLEREPV